MKKEWRLEIYNVFVLTNAEFRIQNLFCFVFSTQPMLNLYLVLKLHQLCSWIPVKWWRSWFQMCFLGRQSRERCCFVYQPYSSTSVVHHSAGTEKKTSPAPLKRHFISSLQTQFIFPQSECYKHRRDTILALQKENVPWIFPDASNFCLYLQTAETPTACHCSSSVSPKTQYGRSTFINAICIITLRSLNIPPPRVPFHH